MFQYYIVHINICGIRSKRSQLMSYLKELDFPEFVTINETLLGSSMNFHIPGYYCASRREPTVTGGARGSMILVRNDVKNVFEIQNCKMKFIEELIGIEIKSNRTRPAFQIYTYYNPPSTQINQKIIELISQQVEPCVLVGDLNCKHVNIGSSKTDSFGKVLMESLDVNNLIVLNDGSPTRCNPHNGASEVLDVAICNQKAIAIFKEFSVVTTLVLTTTLCIHALSTNIRVNLKRIKLPLRNLGMNKIRTGKFLGKHWTKLILLQLNMYMNWMSKSPVYLTI